ncbi:MAG TPA: tetratricopeptide repeat protein [Candidatus Polarisedimenticolia bacterium]|jgi:tetratricopeptide (TPR) repeat protein
MEQKGRVGRSRAIWIVLAAAAALRVIYLFDYRAHSVFWDKMLLDAELYDNWAVRIAAGDWLSGTEVFTLPPLYPYFLAVLYRMFGHGYSVVYVIQSCLGLANIYLIYAIGRKVFAGRAPLIAAAMATLYGSFMFMESKLMSTTLALTLGLCLMRMLLWAGEAQTLTLWGACGAMLGLTALARPETLVFVPFAAWWIHRVTRRGAARKPAAAIDQYLLAGRQPWFAICAFACFVVIAVSPVTMRNWVVSDDWSLSNLISSQAGITFHQSNNEKAVGLYVFLQHEGFSGSPASQAEEEKALAEKATGLPMKRSEVTRYWMGRGLSWIVANPTRFVALEFWKLVRFLGSYEYSTEYIIYVERESVKSLWLTCLPFAAFTALGLAGIAMQRREGFRAPSLLLLLFVVSNLLVVMMFYVSSRYRMPSAPYLILFAASAVERMWNGYRSRIGAARTEAWIYAGIAATIFAVFHPQVDASSRIQEANTHYNSGNQYFEKKRYEDAIKEYDRSLVDYRTNWRAWYNRGNALLAVGRKPEAIESFRQALKHNKNMAAARRQIESLGGTP